MNSTSPTLPGEAAAGPPGFLSQEDVRGRNRLLHFGFPAVHTALQKELKSHKIFVGYFVFVFEIIAPIICLLDMRIYIFALASTK